MLYFTADLHFGHKGLLRHVRPQGRFASTEARDVHIINVWNRTVNPGDDVWILGDVALTGDIDRVHDCLSNLRGRLFLVAGNHDKMILEFPHLSDLFKGIWDYRELKIGDPARPPGAPRQKIVLSHYPFERWNGSHKGSWHLHGHEHGSLPQSPFRRMDVGIDANDYKLVSLLDASRTMSERADTGHH